MASYATSGTYRVLLAALMLIPPAMAACASSDSVEATTATTASATVSTNTISPTTAAPITAAPGTTGPASEIIDITYDGSECTATGPTAVPMGVQAFVVRNLTDERNPDMRTWAIAEGYTYEDILDLQRQPGEYVPLPSWAEFPLTTFEPVDRDLADNELGKTLILEPGEHGITIRSEEGLWFCGALEVTTQVTVTHEAIGVTFDGSLCSVDDPPEVAAGDRTFVFTNKSNLPVRMKVSVLADGKTYQDLLAIQTENGGPGNNWSGPAWLPEALISFTPADLDLADNQSALRYNLEFGPHAVLAFSTAPPALIWLCGPLTVAEG